MSFYYYASYAKQTARKAQRIAVRTAVTSIVLVGAVELTTKLPSQGRSSKFYHSLADEYITPLMRQLLDPETAHHTAIWCAEHGLSPRHSPSALEQRLSVKQSLFGSELGVIVNNTVDGGDKESFVTATLTDAPPRPIKELVFKNPIGLAAGFDKDGQVIQSMLDLGFGFVEIGTVTPIAQPGNPKPRMFRLTPDLGIINRYGFNSVGAIEVATHLQQFRVRQHDFTSGKMLQDEWQDASILKRMYLYLFPIRLSQGIVGVNIGKNKETEDAAADYVTCIEQLGPYADYLVLNVSSPNTPGLRGLQQQDVLSELITSCQTARDKLPGETRIPLLVKLAPDLTDDELFDIAKVALDLQVDGLVVCNTTNQRPDDLLSPHSLTSPHRNEAGGLSGKPVKDRSTACISLLFQATHGKIPIIGVGGVGSGRDAYEKLRAGASLVQIYSMMIFNGPGVVSRIRHELADILLANGYRSVEEVVGADHAEMHWQRQSAQSMKKRKTEGKMIAINELE